MAYVTVKPTLLGAATVALSSLVLSSPVWAQQTTTPSERVFSAAEVRATISAYCLGCHNDRLRTAGLSLASVDVDHVPKQAEIWEMVAARLRSGAMPPPGARRPDDRTSAAVATWIESTIDAAAASNPDPGRRVIHRLNRAEYANAVRDLVALEIDGRSLLPADDQGFGFDNNADALTLSPGLMDRYLLSARRIARLAVGDPSTRPYVEIYPVSRLLNQADRASDELPFGSRGGLSVTHQFPVDAEYVLRVRLQGATARSGEQVDVRLDGARLGLFTTGGRPPSEDGTPDPPIEVKFAVRAGARVVGASVVKRNVMPEGTAPARLPVANISFRAAGIGAIEIEGPFNVQGPGDTPSRRRLFVCTPTRRQEERGCAIDIVSTLARRAYRRPVEEKDVRTLLSFYERGRADGFEAGIRAALERVLIDPEFLFRVERRTPRPSEGRAERVGAVDLASRLSFFLWSSLPDDGLMTAATSGRLATPAGLEAEVRRMLADARSRALVTNFAAQWLHLRNMRAVAPDANEYPEFDDNLREAFQRETELLLEHEIGQDHSVTRLLDADYTFLNERLARHYGVPHVYGSHFRKVTLDRPERRGLLGHGSVLTVTSYATRTSPVVRGKWLLENMLGAPPPAPPDNVPALKENGEGDGEPTTVRQRMEEHRRNPVCASCHARMDPLGFALENFDAIGKWRESGEDRLPIDASGTLPDGTAFDGPVELRRLLVSRREAFVAAIAEKMLTYALGRGLDYTDRPALRRIVREASASDARWSSLVLAIVNSTPFQMRRPRS
jgi:mono/diheme cytochrome c family protein